MTSSSLPFVDCFINRQQLADRCRPRMPLCVIMPKQLSGAAKKKKKKRKRDNQFIESQRGALNKYLSARSSVDVNNNNQRPISDPRQKDDGNIDRDLEFN